MVTLNFGNLDSEKFHRISFSTKEIINNIRLNQEQTGWTP